MKKIATPLKRIGTGLLALALVVSFMPMIGEASYADDTSAKADRIEFKAPSEVAKADGLDKDTIAAIASDAGMTEDEVIAAAREQGINTPDQDSELIEIGYPAESLKSTPLIDTITLQSSEYSAEAIQPGDLPDCPKYQGDTYDTARLDVTFDKNTGMARVTGTTNQDQFEELYVDDYYVTYLNSSSFSKEINMKDYEVGYHEIYATLQDSDNEVYYAKAIPTYIYDKPTHSLSNFQTGTNCITYKNSSTYDYDYYCDLYLEYKKSGEDWSAPQGPFDPGVTLKKTGLKSNTNYSIRTFFGKEVEYNGQAYLFSGKDCGQISSVKTVKTAMGTKPAVKSIKTSKVKQFYRTWTVTIYIGGYAYLKKYKAYYTSFKCNVKMKKKPGTAGIYIGTIRKSGNKKSYTANFVVSGKYKGKKATFSVQSYQNKTYGGISPAYKKKVRIH